LLEKLAMEAKVRLLRRTEQGKDADGKEFQPYSDKHRRLRVKRGRQVKPVNLSFTGQMLADIHTKTDPAQGEAILYFGRAEEAKKAYYHNESGAGKKRVIRKFFAINDEDRKALRRMVREHIKDILGGR